MFSRRVPSRLTSNRITQAVACLGSAGVEIIDLTSADPTHNGFRYPAGLLDGLCNQSALRYQPEPLGLQEARRAVARHLQRYNLEVDAGSIVLTASTSESYAILFKLLCDAGDHVLVPRPSYPLFDHLTRLDSVQTKPYQLDYHGQWKINVPDLQERLTPRTRAILLVNPNNPTASFISDAEFEGVRDLCARADLAIIVDEVFGFYPMSEIVRGPSVFDHSSDVLTFGLGGLSKAVGLPQLKLGWIIVGGPASLVRQALSKIEFICDTYLSVSTPVQLALESLLESGMSVADQITQRIRRNYATLRSLTDEYPASSLLPVDGGWYAPIQVPAIRSEETLVLELLDRERVLVHPGYFFDFSGEAFLVLSLLAESELFEDAVTRMLARVAGGRQMVHR